MDDSYLEFDEKFDISSGEDLESEQNDGDEQAQEEECSYYALLGLPTTASHAEIRRAYLLLSSRYHTDKHLDASPELQQVMKSRFLQLTTAYGVLSDPRQRVMYDLKGPKGPEQLALVPRHIHSSQDIVDLVKALDRAAKLKRMARMLSSSSQMEVNYSSLPLQQYFRRQVALTADPSSVEGDSTEGGEEHEAVQPASASSSTGEGALKPLVQATDIQSKVQDVLTNSEVAVATLDVGGKQTIVLIPNQERMKGVMDSIAELKHQEGVSSGARHPHRHSRVLPINRLLPFALGVKCLVPTSVSLQHSFQHATSAYSYVKVSGQCSSEASPSVNVALNVSDPTQRSSAISFTASAQKIACSVSRSLPLSPLWSMTSKLCLFDGLKVLRSWKVSLQRRITENTLLENTLRLSMWGGGHSFLSSVSASNYLLSVITGPNLLRLTAVRAYEVDFLTPHAVQSPRKKPKKPSLIFSYVFLPFAGVSVVGWKFLLGSSMYFRLGIGFQSTVPYSVSLTAPPYFIVQSTTVPASNIVTLVYQRGNHSLSIPIAVFTNDGLPPSLCWILAPLVAIRVGILLYYPFAKAFAARHYEKERTKHIAEMDVARNQAILEQDGIAPSAKQGREAERQQSGLIILQASYGVLNKEFSSEIGSPTSPTVKSFIIRPPLLTRLSNKVSHWIYTRWFLRREPGFVDDDEEDQSSAFANAELLPPDVPLSIDVTIPLQSLVSHSTLTLPAGTKSKLPGFYDPDPYTPELKELKIEYLFREKRHVVILNDDDEVLIPQHEHLMEVD